MKYYETFGEGGFHSAFLTTFAFGAQAFEDIPFPKLRGAGCRNIVVLGDRAMINQSFADFGAPRFAGTSYHLVKAEAPCAFHPKITLLLGETKGRLMVGSANLTALGLGGNLEQVATLNYSADQPQHLPHLIKAFDYIRGYVPKDDPWFETAVQRALSATPWFRFGTLAEPAPDIDSGVNLLLDQKGTNLLEQIATSVGADPIDRLLVVSPYWDKALDGLNQLRAKLGNPEIDLLLDPDGNGFPTAALPAAWRMRMFDARPYSEGRFLHAKLIIALGRDWDHVISGSMNCTRPALLGPSAEGNAEAAIYRRLPAGTALQELELDGYREEPLAHADLVILVKSFATDRKPSRATDGGGLTISSGRLHWSPPASTAGSQAAILSFYDKDERALGSEALDLKTARSWPLDSSATRPKTGTVTFSDGTCSAPIQITDLDLLTVTTQPARKGKTKQYFDRLVLAQDEDLALLEALNHLEALEEEKGESSEAPTTQARAKSKEAPKDYGVLSYDDYVRARIDGGRSGKTFGTFQSRPDRAANLISACLNRLINLVSADPSDEEERDFQIQKAIDLRTTEPTEDVEAESSAARSARPLKTISRTTARKLQDAVSAFEDRCRKKRGKTITTAEIVRLRTLLQIILNHAQPISGTASNAQLLPIYHAEGFDWPRLVGRLIRLHFGTSRALQHLDVEQDEVEQLRVLEYLALANWSVSAALEAVRSHRRTRSLEVPLATLQASLKVQTEAILCHNKDDRRYFDRISGELDSRFGRQLNLARQSEHCSCGAGIS